MVTSRLDALPPAPPKGHPTEPCIDRFGACVSAVVLIAALTAILVVRQNLDDHVYGVARTASPGTTTGSAAGSR